MTDKLVVEEDLYNQLRLMKNNNKCNPNSIVQYIDISYIVEHLTLKEEGLVLRYLNGDDEVELISKGEHKMIEKLVVEDDLYTGLYCIKKSAKYKLNSMLNTYGFINLIKTLTPDEEILVLRYLGGDDNVELINKDIEKDVQLSKGDIVQLPNGDKVRVTHSVAIKVKTV